VWRDRVPYTGGSWHDPVSSPPLGAYHHDHTFFLLTAFFGERHEGVIDGIVLLEK